MQPSARSLNLLLKNKKVNLSKKRKINNLKMLFIADGRSSPASKEAKANAASR